VAERRLAVQHLFGELPSEPGVEAAQPRACGPVAAGRDQTRNLLNLAGADVPSGGERIGQTSQQRAPVRVRRGSDGFDVDPLKGVNCRGRQQAPVLAHHNVLVGVLGMTGVPTPTTRRSSRGHAI
jgi:hypothetical protein